MPNQSFDVNWSDVPLINQLNNMSCWAAAAAMVVGWRDRLSIDPSAIAAGTGDWAAYANGLNPADVPTLASAWQLTSEPPQSYSIDSLRDLIQSKGPLWIGAAVPGLHAIVVTGMYSDGSVDNTFVRINDPWDRDPGSPGQPGAYLNTHDNGSQYVLTLQQFVQEYESAATFPDVNVQILHPEGRS
ncbi:MAG TPA: papain-like cysteine protease family protein [Candidatus Angelobacter sp.]|nr:papain-like cysteine protease family protein [Candidatus Angelobacter sp.]